ncbi:hydrogenase formation protein HypD [Prochlorothrix hollandica]|uniref:Hydrogenase formation protein HupD n=1 Tax=Prochlorothrix hollandica PCC 9006 = CALU 1027 TaxID=317619 RepID=A0A0M2PX99_PROHO|nr:hydrogenase formation protein HypD [Prochlorothrix hollandica]KKI98996.1 hydrogenase formation protein HupD [Prochlorothrix hollandica PCC 9006 = CALU 1027]
MKFVDEYRDQAQTQGYAQAIDRLVTRPWTLMEICGGQTHAIVKYGLDELLPASITLIHGPGCPVCVTPSAIIDQAIALAQQPAVILCSFGDMLRVPGSMIGSPGDSATAPCALDLLSAKAAGGDVRMVYSPLDALKLAQAHPDRQVVFLAVGFETTAPATALAVYQAQRLGLSNFSLLVSHVLVPPAMEALLSSPQCQVQGFLAAGHVCTVMGYGQYEAIAQRYGVPIVVTGFEPLDVMQGIYHCLQQLEAGQAEVTNQYTRSVQPHGNPQAQQMMDTVFEVIPRQWRGLGEIPHSGLGLRSTYQDFDATQKLKAWLPSAPLVTVPTPCISGQILQGLQKPHQCPAFGHPCTPENPLGAPMVSSEGACAAYYRYRQDGSDR